MSGLDEGVVRDIGDEAAVRGCFGLMRQLRPHLVSEDVFLQRWLRQTVAGYRLLGLYMNGCPVALAGYRLQENMVHGCFLYVDDLVTDEAWRGKGYGECLLVHLRQRALDAGCVRLVLDTSLSNALGQRFYFRCGLLPSAMRFIMPIGE